MLERPLEAPEVEERAISYQSPLADQSEERAISYQSPLADQSLLSSPTIPPLHLIHSNESRTSNTSQHSKRRRVYEESEKLYEPSQAEERVEEEVDINRIEEENEHRSLEAHAEESPAKFGEPNIEWDEYEQNRGIDVDEGLDCQRDGEDLPTIEDQ